MIMMEVVVVCIMDVRYLERTDSIEPWMALLPHGAHQTDTSVTQQPRSKYEVHRPIL